MSELKPCPFCGGNAEIDAFQSVEDEQFCVKCIGTDEVEDCGVIIETINDENEAINNWNTRPIEDNLKAENERLREVIKEIVEPLEAQDREYLYTKIIELKQTDGEGWAIGEVIKRILETARQALKGGEK